MTKKEFLLMAPALLLSLAIYLFYRTEKTVVNQLLIALISHPKYAALRGGIAGRVALPHSIIYSLPEGLWVFCITLTSRHFYLRAGRWLMYGAAIPLVAAIGLEVAQLFHLIRGRFDVVDVLFSVAFWLLGYYGPGRGRQPVQNLFPFKAQGLVCVMSYAIVYLAHVVR